VKNAVFWDVAPCTYFVNRSWISYTLKMEAIRSSETSVNKISALRHIPEDGIIHFIEVSSSSLFLFSF
jgi:hypothetical protein